MVAARFIVVWSVIPVACPIIAWLVVGRPVALFLDRFITLRLRSLPVSPLEYDVANLQVSEMSMPLLGPDDQRLHLSVQSDS
jgi:hypothetical protein